MLTRLIMIISQYIQLSNHYVLHWFPGGASGKESACLAGDPGLIPGSGRSHGEGNGTPLQYSCRGNLVEIRAWWATVHGIAIVRHNLVTKNLHHCHSKIKN